MKSLTLLTAAHHSHESTRAEKMMHVQQISLYCSNNMSLLLLLILLWLIDSLSESMNLSCSYSSLRLITENLIIMFSCLKSITIKTTTVMFILIIWATTIMKLTLTLIKHCSTVYSDWAAEAACQLSAMLNSFRFIFKIIIKTSTSALSVWSSFL